VVAPSERCGKVLPVNACSSGVHPAPIETGAIWAHTETRGRGDTQGSLLAQTKDDV
jgi:hypothetical protein